MSRLHFDQDIQPLPDFRAGVASFIRQVNETRRPIVITQRGKGVDVSEYEAMQEKLNYLKKYKRQKLNSPQEKVFLVQMLAHKH